MRAVFGLVLILGVALAGGAVYMASTYIKGYEKKLASQQQQTFPIKHILVAKEPLRYGQPITPDEVEFVAWPEDSLPDGVFTDAESFFSKGGDAFRITLRPMEPKEPVLALKVTEPGEDAGLTSRLKKGMRAFTIRVDVTSGVSGFLRPGDRVDVFWTGPAPSGTTRQDITKLILTNLELIAIDQKADVDTRQNIVAQTVTVEVTPQHVASLAQAQNSGRLSLALVGAEDDTIATAEDVDQRMLLGVVEEQVVEVAKPEVCTIRTRRGAEVVEIPIPCAD